MKIQVLIAAVISSFILYGCEDNETNYLELSESSFSNVDGDGATLTVSVTSDVEWQISKTAQWCNVTPSKGFGNQTLTLQIEANPDSKERKVTVTVASPVTKMSRKIEITQATGYTPIEQYHYNLPVVFHVLYQNKSGLAVASVKVRFMSVLCTLFLKSRFTAFNISDRRLGLTYCCASDLFW